MLSSLSSSSEPDWEPEPALAPEPEPESESVARRRGRGLGTRGAVVGEVGEVKRRRDGLVDAETRDPMGWGTMELRGDDGARRPCA
jgi:hypothetical protein